MTMVNIESDDNGVGGVVDDRDDDDYIPSDCSENSDEYDMVNSEKERLRNERTFLVYEEKLFELLAFCPKCGGVVDRTLIEEVPLNGSQVHFKFNCFNNCQVDWKSQPTVGDLKGLGNLFMSTSIAFSGIPFAKIDRFAKLINLKFISDSVYYQIKRDFIVPVVKSRWMKERKNMFKLLKSRNIIILVGDGRCDSPGHSAKYCTYTFIDTETGNVIDTEVVPVSEVKNSNAMEKEGFVRILNRLKKEGVKVDIVSTDKHTQIRKLMRVDPNFNHIKHQIDPWHNIKNISKKINKASKIKSRTELLKWIPSIVNHFWWSITTGEKNAQIMYEKFSSIIFHCVNRHSWGGCKYFKQCEHPPLTEREQHEREWLIEGSEAHQYLVSLVKDKNLKNDFNFLTEAIHTTNVEVFNNLMLKYIPKQYHFEYDHMIMGAYLAALDNNFNTWQKQETNQEGKVRFKIAWRKPKKDFIARKVFQRKNYDYLKIMLSSVYNKAKNRNKAASRKRPMAPLERDDRSTIIERAKKLSRFKES